MRIRLICVGRLKESFYTEAVAEFKKRLSRFCELEILELPDEKVKDDPSDADIERVKGLECGRILERVGKDDYVAALDPRGKQLSSEELANRLSELMVSGRSRIAFIIGGSHGLTDEVRQKANTVISFSRMTF